MRRINENKTFLAGCNKKCQKAKAVATATTRSAQIIDFKTKEPLPGANIIILNSNPLKGASSDINGKFNLSVAKTNTVQISYQGYKTVRLSGEDIRGKINLMEESEMLNEVVITAKKTVLDKKWLYAGLGLFGFAMLFSMISSTGTKKVTA